jgi:hypothetical protein
MLAASRDRIQSSLSDRDLVLDVGGWAKPLGRADWVIDLMPYETRGLYGERGMEPERFSADTWVRRDICDREPWPFADDRFDFAVCSHTLEDVRDPVWVCAELNRVARAGYIEVPSRLEEQARGIHGPWVGWSHHHWLVDVGEGEIEFVFKSGVLQGRAGAQLEPELVATLSEAERVQALFWRESFGFRERIFLEPGELDAYLDGPPAAAREELRRRLPGSPRRSSLRGLLRRASGR